MKKPLNIITNLMQSQRNKSHYSDDELQNIGFREIGDNVLISKFARIYSPEKITLKNNIRIDDFAILSGKITIGNFVHIANYASITGGESGVVFGDFCGMSSYAKIYASSDDFYNGNLIGPCILDNFRNVLHKEVILKRHNHIGSHSLVLPGSIFEIGASLGAMSLNIGRKLKSWNYYFGNPAKIIYKIDSKKIEQKEFEFLRLWED